MGKIRTDRLLKLADFLETVPKERFDLKNWQTHAPDGPKTDVPGGCGFAGCAVGWAAHENLFRGFSLKSSPRVLMAGPQPYYKSPAMRRPLRHGEAVQWLFGITGRDVETLFVDTHYPGLTATPKQVAKKIRKFVKYNAEAR